MKHFNNAGPCKPDIHYMLPVASRLPEVRRLVDQQHYFVLHAPRQIGKTTTLMQLAQELTAEGRYTALLVSAEVGSAFNHDPGAAELAMLGTWQSDARIWLPPELRPPAWPEAEPGQRTAAALEAWALASSRPLVIFLDEIDALENETLLSVLRQLRNGFRNRPRGLEKDQRNWRSHPGLAHPPFRQRVADGKSGAHHRAGGCRRARCSVALDHHARQPPMDGSQR